MTQTLHYPSGAKRVLIVGSTVMSATMFAVDSSIANVALPHMQATMSASMDQVLWIVTIYMIAAAIATPLSSWLASRYGRRPVLLLSVVGFTLASAACGMANDLTWALIARAVQGMTGAGLIPLSQAAVLDITPPQDQARAMTIQGIGSMGGPLIGPTLGGWLTDSLSWRWVYFINVPIGVIAFVGLLVSLPDARDAFIKRFDMFGFLMLSLFLASFQLMMDRGEHLDWFESREIVGWAVLMGLGLYLFLVHTFTAKNTFVRPQLFADRNYSVCCVLGVTIGLLSFATIPITTVMMQQSLGYTPFQTGLISSPRGIGTLISMIFVARLIGRVDSRHFLIAGLALNAYGLFMLSGISLQVDQRYLLLAGLFQGLGSGLIFPPLSALVFMTLPAAFRNEGAAMFALIRSMGSSVGISFLQSQTIQNSAAVQSRLTEGLRPDSTAMQFAMPDFDFESLQQLAGLTGRVTGQSLMVAYVDIYWAAFVLAIVTIPMVLLLRSSRTKQPHQPHDGIEIHA